MILDGLLGKLPTAKIVISGEAAIPTHFELKTPSAGGSDRWIGLCHSQKSESRDRNSRRPTSFTTAGT